jgi:hypothetical protein
VRFSCAASLGACALLRSSWHRFSLLCDEILIDLIAGRAVIIGVNLQNIRKREGYLIVAISWLCNGWM